MKLSDFKKLPSSTQELNFTIPNRKLVPQLVHETEVGQVKNQLIIDLVESIRIEKVINLQLSAADGFNHLFAIQKLKNVNTLSEGALDIEDPEIEVEYQSDPICKYGLNYLGNNFILTNQFTACLAIDNCGIPNDKLKISISELQNTKKTLHVA